MRKAPILNAATANRIEAHTNHHREAGSPIIPASRSKSKEENDTMNKTENMAAMLLTLTQSDEWFQLCDSDEGIREANDNLQLMMDKLTAGNPNELTEQLWEAVCCVCDACSAVAMLYGIRIANTIRDVSAQSLSLTMQALRQSRIKAGT